MELIQADPKELTPYPGNPRINDRTVELLTDSIREYGFRQPIVVDEDMVVLAGHARLKAALKMGLETVPVVIAVGLTEEQKRAYRLADNKTADLTEWDRSALEAEGKLIGEALTGYGLEFAPESGSAKGTVHAHICPRCKHEF